jgi:hypothetical protein
MFAVDLDVVYAAERELNALWDPTVHLTSLVTGSVFFEGLKMTR